MKSKYLFIILSLFLVTLFSCSKVTYKEGTIKEFYLDKLSPDSTLYVQMITRVNSVTHDEMKDKKREILDVKYRYGVDTVKLFINRYKFDTDRIKVLYTLEVHHGLEFTD